MFGFFFIYIFTFCEYSLTLTFPYSYLEVCALRSVRRIRSAGPTAALGFFLGTVTLTGRSFNLCGRILQFSFSRRPGSRPPAEAQTDAVNIKRERGELWAWRLVQGGSPDSQHVKLA